LQHVPANAQPGRSFRVLLEGGHPAQDRDVVVYDEYGPVRMLRTREWKYVHRYPDGPHELYDLEADPGERSNLVDDVRHRPTVASMRERMQAWFDRYGDASRDGAHRRITGCGQLGLMPPTGDGSTVFAADPIAPLRMASRR